VQSSGYGPSRTGWRRGRERVTKSARHVHGSTFYYLRDSSLGGVRSICGRRSHNERQFGATVGGRSAQQDVLFAVTISNFNVRRWWNSSTVQ